MEQYETWCIMGKISNIRTEIRGIKRMLQYVLSDNTNTYSLHVFGMWIKGKSLWIYVMLPVFLGVAYAGCAVSLYAFGTLLGIPEFSWINAFWWMVILATFVAIFKGGD